MNKTHFPFVVSVLILMTTACLPNHSPQQALSEPNHKDMNTALLSADEVVKDYYKYIAEHDVQSASEFLSPDVASLYHSTPDSDFNNVISISNVVVSKPANIGLDNKYKYEVQVDATYIAQYRKIITVPNGGQTRFIYLGRNGTSEPWEIVSIGTGP